MDREQLCRLINEALIDIPNKDLIVTLEGNEQDNIRILVVSNFFKGMNLSSRIDLISESLMDLITSDTYSNYHFIINALTINEKTKGTSETLQEKINKNSSAPLI